MTRAWSRSFWSSLALMPCAVVAVAVAHRRLRLAGGFPLADGDIVFRLGHAGRALGPLIGNLGIAASSLGPYSHIALVVAVDERQPGRSRVIEATRGVGVRLLSLERFLRRSIYAGIFRPDVEAATRQAAVAYARAQVGRGYDETFGLDDPLRPGRTGEPAAHYCSGLIWSAYRAGGVDIADGRRTVYRHLPLAVARRIYPHLPEGELVLPNDIFNALLAREVATRRRQPRLATPPARRDVEAP